MIGLSKRTVFCSTGAMVGRSNKYDYRGAAKALYSMAADGLIDGAELMMITPYYEILSDVADTYCGIGVAFPVIHCEKDIGEMLSDYSVAKKSGDNRETLLEEAFRLFRINCKTGEKVGAKRMVLHLWGGAASDSAVEGNAAQLRELIEVAAGYGIKLLIENVPCTTNDPLSNWRIVERYLPDIGYIFDSRFGAFHGDTDEIFADVTVVNAIEHIHISDFIGFDGTKERDFSRLRPILHPGEGKVDFASLASKLDRVGYNGTFTIESPVMSADGIDEAKMRATVTKTRQIFNII